MENLAHYVEVAVFGILILLLLFLLFFSIERYFTYKVTQKQIHTFENKTELEIHLNSKIAAIAAISSNVLYVGLLGTTLGMILTLRSIDAANKQAMIDSLSLPLLATAASLVVAIVGNILYSILTAKAELVLKEWDLKHGHDVKKAK